MRHIVSAFLLFVAFGCSSLREEGSTPTALPPTTKSEPVVGFDFSGALVPGVDRSAVPPIVVIPECFGGVTRVALVGEDMQTTQWEVVPADLQNPPLLGRVALGDAPDGFVTKVPLAEGAPLGGILVVNGPENIGLVVLSEDAAGVTPKGCG